MDNIQSKAELDQFHSEKDPWGYESNSHDTTRKRILLSELPEIEYKQTLDIGCGQGFITRDLPGEKILGIDISSSAIERAQQNQDDRIQYQQGSLFQLPQLVDGKFDLIVITGVLYPQYIGDAESAVYSVIDQLLDDNGILVSVHISAWYRARFPLLMLKSISYQYREYTHLLEVYSR